MRWNFSPRFGKPEYRPLRLRMHMHMRAAAHPAPGSCSRQAGMLCAHHARTSVHAGVHSRCSSTALVRELQACMQMPVCCGALVVCEEVCDDRQRYGIADILGIAPYGLECDADALALPIEDRPACTRTADACRPHSIVSLAGMSRHAAIMPACSAHTEQTVQHCDRDDDMVSIVTCITAAGVTACLRADLNCRC